MWLIYFVPVAKWHAGDMVKPGPDSSSIQVICKFSKTKLQPVKVTWNTPETQDIDELTNSWPACSSFAVSGAIFRPIFPSNTSFVYFELVPIIGCPFYSPFQGLWLDPWLVRLSCDGLSLRITQPPTRLWRLLSILLHNMRWWRIRMLRFAVSSLVACDMSV